MKKSAQSLKQLLTVKNVSVETLANKTDVDVARIEEELAGGNVLDLKELENVARFFGVDFDEFVNGKAGKKTAEKFDSTEWFKLDNAAKIYPADTSEHYSMIFRLSAVTVDRVDPVVLQQALDDVTPRFPTFMVTLKKGLFWYYLEKLPFKPRVEKDSNNVMRPIPLDGKRYLFRILYSDYRISAEFFHSITDGTGGSIFLVTLLSRYVELKYGITIEDYASGKNYRDFPTDAETVDSFQEYAEKGNYAKREVEFAYIPKGKKSTKSLITHLTMDASLLNQTAKKYGATITEYVTAKFVEVLFDMKKKDASKKHVIVQVPVNLRKFFPSETLRNFAYFLNIKFEEEPKTFEDIVAYVKKDFKDMLGGNYLQSNINANMREERNKLISIVPLFLKNVGLFFAKMLLGDKALSINFSNLGRLVAPKELSPYLSKFEFTIKEPKALGYNTSGITYNGKCVLTISRSIVASRLEKAFVNSLVSDGLKIYVESNNEIL